MAPRPQEFSGIEVVTANHELPDIYKDDDIVISGLSGRFPESRDVYEFRENLLNKKAMITFDDRRYPVDIPEVPSGCGKIEGLEEFDGGYFGFNPRQCDIMDPQARIGFEKAYEALLDAGVNPETLRGTNTAIVTSMCYAETERFHLLNPNGSDYATSITVGLTRALGARIAYSLGLKGSVYCLDSACSSSLVAVERAFSFMKRGSCNSALVITSNLCIDPVVTQQFYRLGVLSADGVCKVFDEEANGYVRAETIAVLYLQRAKDSKRIYAKIVHTKSNCDGLKEKGITFPGREGQEQLLQGFYDECKVDPSTIDFVEAHGTGTEAGDPEECITLDKVFCTNRKGPLLLGSCKSNMGHSEPSSGVAAIAKAISILELGKIPPNINLKTPKPSIAGIIEGRLKVVTETTPFTNEKGMIGVNSFGFGGTNSHALVQRFPKPKINGGQPEDDIPRILAVSGRVEESVKTILDDVKSRKLDAEFVYLLNDLYLQQMKGHTYKGFSILTKTEEVYRYISKREDDDKPHKIIFAFPGVNTEILSVEKTLLNIPNFISSVETAQAAVGADKINIIAILSGKKKATTFVEKVVATVALQIGLVDCLATLGVFPDAVLGLSIGELAAAYSLKKLNASQAIQAAYSIGSIISEAKLTPTITLETDLRLNELQAALPAGVEISEVSTGNRTKVVGPVDAVRRLQETLKGKGVYTKEIDVAGVGLQSSYVSSVKSAVVAALTKIIPYPIPKGEKWLRTSKRDNEKDESLCGAEYLANILINKINLEELEKLKGIEAILLDFGNSTAVKNKVESLCEENVYLNLDENSKEEPIQFLSSVGRLFTYGFNISLNALYPTVKYPVARGTPMISPLVRWDHSRDFHWPKYTKSQGSFKETTLDMNFPNESNEYLTGHMIDGRILFPATGYLRYTCEVYTQTVLNTVVFQDVSFMRATPLVPNSTVKFVMNGEESTNSFAIIEGNAPVVKGIIKMDCPIEPTNPAILVQPKTFKCGPMDKKSIYKELRLRGYQYSGLFEGLESVDETGLNGLIRWNDNWVAFLDTMLHIMILNWESRELNVPVYMEKVSIDFSAHSQILATLDPENQVIPVHYYPDVNLVKCGAVEVWNLRAQPIPRRSLMADPVLETYHFAPTVNTTKKYSLQEATRLIIHLALENMPGIKVKVLEMTENAPENTVILSPILSDILADLPLIQYEVHLEAAEDSPLAQNLLANISLDPAARSKETDCAFTVGYNLLGREGALNQALQTTKDTGFVIAREQENVNVRADGIDVLADYVTADGRILLLRKTKVTMGDVRVVKIDNYEKDSEFKWISTVKEALNNVHVKKVILLAQNTKFNGILGLSNCLTKEPAGEKVQCVYIRDPNAPEFDINLPLYANQLAKKLAINVFENGEWGSYRHLRLPDVQKIQAEHVILNNVVRGDLSSLNWFNSTSEREVKSGEIRKNPHIQIHYSSINFKDIMVASGRVYIPNTDIGIEFSGINENGERVMGFANKGAMTTYLVDYDPKLVWKVPDNLTLAEAATTPVVYLTSYQAIVGTGRAKRGDSILIHSACGGIGLAAINISLALGLEIYVTVGTNEKREYLHKHYPQIPDSRIGNSRDLSFEAMIKKETKKRGVDMVLNSLSEDKLLASIRCLASNGRFLEIGKYDVSNNFRLGLEPFLEHISYHTIMMDVVAVVENGVSLDLNFEDILRTGIVKPLPATIFPWEQAEQAFRFLTTGKHIGKSLIKLRDEELPRKAANYLSAIPKFYCQKNGSYIILGGLGGFGLELAQWLFNRGAKNLILTSRNGIRNGYQRHRVSLWRRHGTNVHISTDDVSTKEGVTKLLNDANQMGPVYGIYNLAALLSDSIFENQTPETFKSSFNGKAIATANLDELSRKLCPHLEQFVVFSSLSCGRGNPGQTNYGMSNSVMERICEERKAEGLPALAIQWGAIGEVGLVAEMAENNLELVIGGTLQQTITSCLECMDSFLHQPSPVVASMVVAEKRSLRRAGSSLREVVAAILGIRDIAKISLQATLPELGMDSMTGVEVKQTLEREFEIYLTAQELRTLTFSKLDEIETASVSGADVSNPSPEQDETYNLLISTITPEEEAREKVLKLRTSSTSTEPIFFIPGMDGFSRIFEATTEKLNWPVYALNHPYNQTSKTIDSLVQDHISEMKKYQGMSNSYRIVAYSAGSLIATKLTAALEELGHKVQLVLLDGSHAMIQEILKMLNIKEDNLNEKIMTSLQNVLHLKAVEKATVDKLASDMDRIKYVKSITAMDHSVDHLHTQFLDYLARTRNSITYRWPENKKLASKVTLIKPNTLSLRFSDDYQLSEITSNPVSVYTVEGNHVTLLSSPDLAKLLNTLLE